MRCPVCGAANRIADVAPGGGVIRCRICNSPLRVKRVSAPAAAVPPPPSLQPLVPPPRRERTTQLTATRVRRPAPRAVPVVPPVDVPPPPSPPRPPRPPEPKPELKPKPAPEPDPVQAAIDRYALFPPEVEPAVAAPFPSPATTRLRSRNTRLGAVAAIVVIAVVGALLWTRTRDDSSPAARIFPDDALVEASDGAGVSSTTSAAPAVAAQQWVAFADPEGRFTVDLPTPPVRESDELPSAIGNLTADVFTSDIGGDSAVVAVVQVPDPAIVDLHSVAVAIGIASGLEISTEAPSVDAAGRSVLDTRLVSGAGVTFLGRFLDDGDGRVYGLIAGSPTGFPDATFARLTGSFIPT